MIRVITAIIVCISTISTVAMEFMNLDNIATALTFLGVGSAIGIAIELGNRKKLSNRLVRGR